MLVSMANTESGFAGTTTLELPVMVIRVPLCSNDCLNIRPPVRLVKYSSEYLTSGDGVRTMAGDG
jgi:hypothetical protein